MEPMTGVNSTASDAGRRREGLLCDGGTGGSGKRPLDSRFDKDSSDKRMKHDEDSLMRGPDGGGGGSGKRPPDSRGDKDSIDKQMKRRMTRDEDSLMRSPSDTQRPARLVQHEDAAGQKCLGNLSMKFADGTFCKDCRLLQVQLEPSMIPGLLFARVERPRDFTGTSTSTSHSCRTFMHQQLRASSIFIRTPHLPCTPSLSMPK